MSSATSPRASSAAARKSCLSRNTSPSASAAHWLMPPLPSGCSRPSASRSDRRHPQRHPNVAAVRQQGHQDLSCLRRVLRHGRRDRAGRELLPPRRTGAGREEADPLSARSGRRRQELDRRAAEAADGARSVLRNQGLAGERVAARPVRSRRRRSRCSRRNTAFRAATSTAS